MASRPLVSVIVPAHNASRFIRTALQSALDPSALQNREIKRIRAASWALATAAETPSTRPTSSSSNQCVDNDGA